ncbi:MAG: glycoside hydrolase family 3 N-terminal domain-containing protein [Pseudanabaenaceae cyanobacterium]
MAKIDPLNLSLEAQVAQMVMVRASGYSLDHQRQYPQWELSNGELLQLIKDGIGGVILVGGTVGEVGKRTAELQRHGRIPLFIAADVEEGVGQGFAGGTRLPPPMALFAIWQKRPALAVALAREMGRIIAKEALAIGINWLFAPVADVNSNPHNPVINVRSFGENPQAVIELSSAFLEGAKEVPVLTCAKHFPGHGDTKIDSHLDTPIIEKDRSQFYEIELPPFQRLIEAGVDGVMTAHLIARAWDEERITTFSPVLVKGLLQEEMGFSGLVITDALVMGGVGNLSAAEIAVQAIQAGVDILLMPPDPWATIEAIVSAVEQKLIPRERVIHSCQKILLAKEKLSSYASDFGCLGNPEHQQVSQQIADLSISYHLPCAPVAIENCLSLWISDRPHPSDAHTNQNLSAISVAPPLLCHLNLDNLPPVFLQVTSRGQPFQGRSQWAESISSFITALVQVDKLRLVLLYGSPYNLVLLKALLPDHIPWGFAYSELGQSILLGKLTSR